MTCPSRLAMWRYSIEPRTRKYVKGYGLLSFARKYKKQLLNAGLDSLKTASKKVVHEAGKCLGNRIADTVNKIVKEEPVEEIIIPPEKKR